MSRKLPTPWQEGQEVEAKIIDVDTDRKRISLSIRALLVPQNDED